MSKYPGHFFQQYRLLFIITLVWILAVLILFHIGFNHFKPGPSSAPTLIESLANWDGRHYLRLAQFGYQLPEDYAFFPLYPLLIYIISPLFSFLETSLFINWLSLLLLITGLFVISKKIYNSSIAYRTIINLLLFPSSFYLLTSHTESLFLALSLWVFITLSPQPKFITFCLLALAMLTKPFGVILGLTVLGYGIRYRWKWYFLPFCFSGLFLHLLWLSSQQQSWSIILSSQTEWLRSITFPWQPLTEQLMLLISGQALTYPINLINFICAVLQIGLAFRSWRYLPKHLSAYSIGLAIFPLLTGSLSSIPRFMIINFPIFITLSLIKQKFIYWTYLIISLMGLTAFCWQYISGNWLN